MGENQSNPYRLFDVAFETLREMGERAERRQERRKPTPRRTPIPDPTVAGAASALAGETWDEINSLRRRGMPWHQAREQALAPKLRDWQRTYGRETAVSAFNQVRSFHPVHDTPKHIVRAEHDRMTNIVRRAKMERGKKITWLDEVCLSLFGLTFN